MKLVALIAALLSWLRAKQAAFFLLVGAGISLGVGFEAITWTEVQIILVLDFLAAAWAFFIRKDSVPKADMEAWVDAAVSQAKNEWDAYISGAALNDTFLTFESTASVIGEPLLDDPDDRFRVDESPA